ncbi:MAG: HAD-IA family hydrolase [Actinomycetia bacterium]|nr:HAD-IA family hydrolase [Actinomycetes bacterium]
MTSAGWPVALFDLDGTLVDTINLIVTSYQHAFRTVIGREWDETEIRSWIGTSLVDALHRELGPELGAQAFRAYTEFNEAHTEELIKGYAGVPELLAALTEAGVRVGVVTSKRRRPAQWALSLTHLDLPLLVAHEDVPVHKPDPGPLLAGAAALQAAPDQVVYVGDAVVDVQAARAAQMAVVAVSWGAAPRSDLVAARPDALCDSPAELLAALLGGPPGSAGQAGRESPGDGS